MAAQRTRLLEAGATALLAELQCQQRQTPSRKKRRALQALWQYVDAHREHTPYRERLAPGPPIGSGLVEGGCKQVIGRRLKPTGARWRCRRADRMATLCTTLYRDLWHPFWNSLSAENPKIRYCTPDCRKEGIRGRLLLTYRIRVRLVGEWVRNDRRDRKPGWWLVQHQNETGCPHGAGQPVEKTLCAVGVTR